MNISRRQTLSLLAGGATLAATNYRIVDPHVHVWKHDPAFPWAPETKKPPERDATPEMLLELMHANGVSRTVLIQYIGYRWDNRYAAAAVKKYPQYFQAVARVNPEDPVAPDQLSQRVEEGFRGVRISPAADAAGDWIRGPLMQPLWKRCEDLRTSLSILTPAARLPDLIPLLDRHPGLTVVIDHMADCPIDQPAQLAPLLEFRRYPKLFVKVSHTWSLSREEYPYRDTWRQVKKLYDAFGPQRLMWGTDWPLVENHCGYAKALAIVRDHLDFLNDDDRHWMLGRTPEKVWPFA
jgi:L-fuconolactonase